MTPLAPMVPAAPMTPLPSIASLELSFAVPTTRSGEFNAIMADLKAPADDIECGTYDLESIFSPFAQAVLGGDLSFDEVAGKAITPAAFYHFADSLSLEDMFEAARDANLAAAAQGNFGTFGAVPDLDGEDMEDILASVPSSLIEDMDVAEVPSNKVSHRRRSTRNTNIHRVVSATATAASPKPKRMTSSDNRQRAPKVAVSEERKDAKYWARREKNNAAARRNRALKKEEKVIEKSLLPALDAQNVELVDEVLLLQRELRTLREALRDRLIREGMAC